MQTIGMVSMGQDAYYFALGPEQYYLNGTNPIGHWFGSGARQEGLFGPVEPDQLRNLFRGLSPDGTRTLLKDVDVSKRRPALDLTFSASKSVSAIYAVCDEPMREAIRHAHQSAVQKALEIVQDYGGFGRRGKAGVRFERVNLIFACFDHDTSRAQDPQIHSHAVLLNIAQRADGTYGALATRDILRLKMCSGAAYRAELAYQLEQRCNLQIERVRDWFEVAGVPKELLREFSNRRQMIEKAVAGMEHASAHALALATLETRPEKDYVSQPELFKRWRELAIPFNFTPENVSSLCQRGSPWHESIEERLDKAVFRALDRLAAEKNHFRETDLLRRVMEECQGLGVSSLHARERVGQVIEHSPDLVRLGVVQGQQRLTLKTTAELEQQMLDRVDALMGQSWKAVRERSVDRVLEREKYLSEEQRAAVRHATLGKGRLMVVEGYPGTGKSQFCRAVAECYQRDGYRVVAVAPTGKAARGLEELTKIKAWTVEGLMRTEERSGWKEVAHHARQLGRAVLGKPTYTLKSAPLHDRTVVLVDEAGMIGVRQMDRLLNVAQSKGCKVILIGDRNQLQPVLDYGGAFAAISRQTGSKVLTEIARQRDAWAREAVKEIAEGQSLQALERFREKGLIDIADNRRESLKRMIADWMKSGLPDPKNHVALFATNGEANEFNRTIQIHRMKRLDLGLFGVKVGEQRLHSGDRVVCTENAPWLHLQNGAMGTVRRTDPVHREIVIDLDHGLRVTIPLKHYDRIQLAYALTAHRAQGCTTENAYVMLGGPHQDKELALVQLSRARQSTRIYTNRWEAGENLEVLAVQMKQSRQQELAVEIARQAEHSPSLRA